MQNTDTLSQALDAIDEDRAKRGIVLADGDANLWRDHFCSDGGLRYGENRSFSAEIETIKGKKTRKGYQIQIWRLDSGRYEPNTYVL